MTRTDRLAKDLREAYHAAEEASWDTADAGTCNFDAPFLGTHKGSTFHRPGTWVEAALHRADLRAFRHDGGRKGFIVSLRLGGQGSKRTKAAEAFTTHLKSKGWTASVWYQMD